MNHIRIGVVMTQKRSPIDVWLEKNTRPMGRRWLHSMEANRIQFEFFFLKQGNWFRSRSRLQSVWFVFRSVCAYFIVTLASVNRFPNQHQRFITFSHTVFEVSLIQNGLRNLTWISETIDPRFLQDERTEGPTNIFRTQYMVLAPQEMNLVAQHSLDNILEPKNDVCP